MGTVRIKDHWGEQRLFEQRAFAAAVVIVGLTLVLIGLNALIFTYGLTLEPDARTHLFFTYGLVPADVSWTSPFTSLFLHTGWLHLAGNLLALWIFGDNVEDRMGHGRFLGLYFLSGVAGALAGAWTSSST